MPVEISQKSKGATIEIQGNGNISPLNQEKKKQGNQLLYWFFTLNNYLETDIIDLEKVFKKICTKYIFQEEVGEKTGTPHLQGTIELKRKMRWSEFNLTEKITWSATRNRVCAIGYCGKDETRKGKTYSFGLPKPIEYYKEDEFLPWQKDVLAIINTKPDKRKVYWIYETEGNTGKSQFTRSLVCLDKALVCQGGKCADLINFVYMQDMDKYNTVIWDLPRSNRGKVSCDAVEIVKNGMCMNTKFETGMKVFNQPHVIIFANCMPKNPEDFSKDRMIYLAIKGGMLISALDYRVECVMDEWKEENNVK